MRLVTGGRDPEKQDDPASHGSYFFALAGAPLASMRDGLESTLIWVGTALARPIHDLVSDIPAEGVTLVPCGPIATTPLHAAPWYDADGQQRCLLDSMAVRYAPSAATIVGARVQAETSDAMPHCLVAVADPKSNLPAARGEVMEISRLFPDAAIVAYGADATRRFVAEHAAAATHLHLACHGAGGLIENSDASLELADGSMDSTTLTQLAGFHARLVAVSACESAVSELTGVPGEMFSLGVATLVAGAACTIGSLWSVDDLATGLLMTKLYVVMLAHRLRPPEALRAAQLWLRDLSEDDEQAFLDVHPALAAEFRKRGVESVVASHRRGPSQRNDETAAHPELWAAFIAMGV
jgi:CHAT domain-containing protein